MMYDALEAQFSHFKNIQINKIISWQTHCHLLRLRRLSNSYYVAVRLTRD